MIESVKAGAGDVLGNVGLILALGTMLGKLLAESGGAERIASTLLARSGPERVPWTMALIAFIVGIPLFFEIGVVLLIPIVFTMAQRVKAQMETASRGRVDGRGPPRRARPCRRICSSASPRWPGCRCCTGSSRRTRAR